LHQTNCLHETFFDAALSDAKYLDDYLAKHGKPIGPLHGVPISLKDQFHIKDVETSMGYIGWIGTFQGIKDDPRKGVYESELVRELRALGAVLYCKTSVPHTLMAGETVNNIIEYTWNPKNRNLCSGGSSGGEGALIGLKGSPAGFGSDIGGSIRIPAAFNGLYGIRPSGGRLPYEGMANSMDGQNSVLSVVGPIATTIGAVKLLVQAILSQSPWLHDPLVIEMPWRDSVEHETMDLIKAGSSGVIKLAFGILKNDGFIGLHPPVARAMQLCADVLAKAGHKVIEWKPPSHQHGVGLVFNAWTYDGGADVHAAMALSGEPLAAQVSMSYGDAPVEQCSSAEISANNVALRKWQKEYMDYWNSTTDSTGTGRPVDGLIAPVAPFAAARPLEFKNYNYSTFVNGLDYTSVVIPVTVADKSIDVIDPSYQPLSEIDKAIQSGYVAEIYDGAHVSVQLVGRRLQEEKMLVLAEYLSSMLKN
jgi:amidase